MFGKYDDNDDFEASSNDTELEAMTDMIANAGLDFDVEDEEDGAVISLDNGITFQFDESGSLVSISPPAGSRK